MYTDPVSIILGQSLAIFLLIGALTGIALALLLILRPSLLARINSVANRWFSTRRFDRSLDRIISLEDWFYRHHCLFGLLATLGAGYLIVFFGLLFDRAAALQHLSAYLPARQAGGWLDALVLAALVGAVLALLVGVFLCLRPSMLRDVEEVSNRWVSSRRATRALAIPREAADIYIARHARPIGWLLLLASLALFFLVLRWPM